MSLKYYDRLLSKIDEESPEYSLLKNAVIIDHSPIGAFRKTIENKLNTFVWWQSDFASRPHLRSR
jgi:hypothetical protein